MMKIRKLTISALLIVALLLSMLVGCSSKDYTDTSTTKNNTSGNSDSGDNGEEVEEPYEIVMELVTLGQDFTSLPQMEEKINEITLPAINATVKFLPVHIADHATKLSLMVAGGDKLDLVVTGITTPLAGLVSNNALLPLDGMLEERAPELVERQGGLLEAFKINGQLYSVAADLYPASSGGIEYNKDYADQLGIEVPDKVDLEYLDSIGETLKENSIYLTTQADGQLNSFNIYHPVSLFGGDYAYGVIFDPENSTEIENFYASDEFREYVLLMKSWTDKGYMPADSLTNGQNGQDVFRSGQIFCQWLNLRPKERIDRANTWPFPVGFAETTEPMLSTEAVQEFGWGIPANSERPEVVIDFLNLMYTNADLANILNNGLEGVEYEKVSDNIIKYVDGINFGNAGYVRVFNRFGDTMQVYQFEPATEDFYNELQAFNDSAKVSKTLGYVFDAESVATELAAVNSVVAEYRPPLLAGAVDDVDAALAEFNEALVDAGIEVIIEENRKQLDAWLAEQ